jgi:hypothetical protein
MTPLTETVDTLNHIHQTIFELAHEARNDPKTDRAATELFSAASYLRHAISRVESYNLLSNGATKEADTVRPD